MRHPLHIIASCADRKKTGHGDELEMRGFNDRDLDVRAERWWTALTKDAPRLPAEDLYVGPYWATVRSLRETAASARFAIDLWVASAGYGLLHASTAVRPYSATFT